MTAADARALRTALRGLRPVSLTASLSDAALNALEDIDQLRSNAIATSVRDELRHRSAAMPKKRERSAEEPTPRGHH
jgi:hypothetical protein